QRIRWIKGEQIGKGSFGRVFHAINTDTGDVIAVKQVPIPTRPSKRLAQEQGKMVESLYAEIILLKDLEHDHIVQYIGFEAGDEHVNLFMEYVAGGTLSSLLGKHGAFSLPVIRSFTRQVASGIAYLHDRSILHRDIKGANILINEEGVCKISDFGISKKSEYAMAYGHQAHLSMQGSTFWMAPEVVRRAGYSAKVDIWSLGCVILEMAAGQRPWMSLNEVASMYRLGQGLAPPIPDRITSVEVREALSHCFAKEPDDRPTAHEILELPLC
ncbi:MAG: kinase-like domain-containing protein, partial [Piptocephalis tieghemiana]